MKQEPISFSLCPENIQYVKESFPLKHRNKSHWLDDLITHLRTKSVDKPKVERSKTKTYPSNLDEQFELLWCAKGKKGSKQKAYDTYKKMAEGETQEILEVFTKTLMDDLIKKQHEAGYQARHLTTYLNGTYWEQ